MKKTLWLAVILLLVCVFAFSACDSRDTPKTPSDTTNNTTEFETDPHVHAFGEWITVKDATCTDKGEQERTCACGEKESKNIDALGHTPGAVATCTVSQSCTVCNKELAASLGHTEVIDEAVAPTCTETGLTEGSHCSVCDEVFVAQTVIVSKGHSEVIDAAVSPTCAETGLTEGKHCSVCDEVLLSQEIVVALGHTPGSEATCTDSQNCSVCGAELASANGHTPGTEATCTTTQICLVCGDTLTAPLGHKEVIDAAVLPTCTEQGLTEGSWCAQCHVVFQTQEVVAPTGHQFVSQIIPPTCTKNGYTKHTCAMCSVFYEDSIVPPTGSLGLQYVVNADKKTCNISGIGTCNDAKLYIPQIIDGYTVVAIDPYAFELCEWIEFVSISETVATIGYEAFYGCTNLTEVIIPSSIESIAPGVFTRCDNLSTIYYNSDCIPTGFGAAKKIVFGGTTIPAKMLYAEMEIQEVVILNSVTSIESNAFSLCSGLQRITIPSSVTSIGYLAFFGCESLEKVYFEGTTEDWCNISCISSPCANGAELYFDGEKVTKLVIPDGITTIPTSQFLGCSSITSVTIPPSVTTIDSCAFKNCKNLKSVTFTGTSRLSNIYYSAFENCTSLESIVIPPSVTTIDSSVFCQCTSLVSIELPERITQIPDECFKGACVLTEIAIPKTVKSIGEAAFENCTSLDRVSIAPNSQLDTIDSGAFRGCKSLVSIDIPDGVTSIGYQAFYRCTSLRHVALPVTLTSIGERAFYFCSGLRSPRFQGTVQEWQKVNLEKEALGDVGKITCTDGTVSLS